MSSLKKYVVPEGMLKAAYETAWGESPKDTIVQTFKVALEAALLWLSENPIVPTDDFVEEAIREHSRTNIKWACAEWQCRMFLSPEPEMPEAIKELLPFPPNVVILDDNLYNKIKAHLDRVAIEAYRRGQRNPK